MRTLVTNCPNCGAALTSDGYCEYCKTKVRMANEIELTDPFSPEFIHGGDPIEILVRRKKGDILYLYPFRGKLQSMEVSRDDEIAYYDDNPIAVACAPRVTITFEGTFYEPEGGSLWLRKQLRE